jgi:glycosyltransferase involved in cell wall biosynthesis
MESTGLNIVHVTTGLESGGAEMMLCKLLEGCKHSTGIRHSVVSLRKGGFLSERIRATGVEVAELDLKPGSIAIGATFRLVDAVRRQRPNIIQGWMYHGNLAATVAKCVRLRSCPLIWGVRHSPGTLQDEKTMTRIMIRTGAHLSFLPAAIVYCSLESARQHESLGYRTIKRVYIPNGFDTDAFQPDAGAKARLTAEIGVDQRTCIIGVVARFHPQKDYRNIIAAAALLSKNMSDVHLILVGEDVDRKNPKIMEMITSFAVEDKVTLLGERRDIARLMPGFDLLCSGSAWGEAFPNVIGEAMASGVPCVTTDVGDSALILGGAGAVVPPRDPNALAHALSRLIALGPEGRRRLGQEGRQRVVENFSIAKIVDQFEALYRHTLRDATGETH